MPNQERYSGTRADRLANFDRRGIRCDANGRMCVNPAVVEFTLLRADGDGNPLPDAQPSAKKACTRHKLMFERSGNYCVLEQRDLPRVPQRKAS
jgi:hypothetical protein